MDDVTEKRLIELFLDMKREETVELVKQEIESGEAPMNILKTCREAMAAVGKRFETGEFFLSELIYSAEVFKAVSAMLEPALRLRQSGETSQGEIVFSTPKGDIHDLGKNIVATMMRAHGFIVHDLGVDTAPEKVVEEVRRTNSPILAMSALITPAFASMKKIISLLEENRLRASTFVIIGGGVTNELARREIGADAQTLNPAEAIKLCKEFMGKRNE